MRSEMVSKLIYISGPISQTNGCERKFGQACEWLRDQGHRVLNPMDIPPPIYEGSLVEQEVWVYYMKEAVAMLLGADCVYMLEGWEQSKGAKLEFKLATDLDIPVHYAADDYKYV